MTDVPLVSVVIPTADRAELVGRAIRSVLAQGHAALDVIVVIDGPDPATRTTVYGIDDARVRTIELGGRVGAAEARNAGVAASRGEWVAFLDDDDEWLPGKLERQLALAGAFPDADRVIVGRVAARDARGAVREWPRRLPDPGEPLSEYLFSRRGPFWGEALVQTSTWMVDGHLARALPFRPYPLHEDLDWLLRAVHDGRARIAFLGGDPIAVWDVAANRPRTSRVPNWTESMRWVRENADLFTARAYASFLLLQVLGDARRQRERGASAAVVREAFARGRPRLRDVLFGAGAWLVAGKGTRRPEAEPDG